VNHAWVHSYHETKQFLLSLIVVPKFVISNHYFYSAASHAEDININYG
jgi:hypothetical protein